MLDELQNLELTSSWKDIKRQIRDDPRYTKFGGSDKVLLRELSRNQFVCFLNLNLIFSVSANSETT
jgi:hypothetical protein